METIASDAGYCPLELGEAMEKIVVDGNRRKYVQLGRSLRFYGGTTSATEVGCNLRCKFCFSDKPVWKPASTGRFYSPQEVFDGLAENARRHGTRRFQRQRPKARSAGSICSNCLTSLKTASLSTYSRPTA